MFPWKLGLELQKKMTNITLVINTCILKTALKELPTIKPNLI